LHHFQAFKDRLAVKGAILNAIELDKDILFNCAQNEQASFLVENKSEHRLDSDTEKHPQSNNV